MKYSKLTIDELIELQKKYRNGYIKESDIPKDQLKDLKYLYHKQIDYLKKKINEAKF